MQDPQYKDLLLEFDGKAQNFVNKCEEFLNISNDPFDVNLIKMQNEIESSSGKLRNFNDDPLNINYMRHKNDNNNNDGFSNGNVEEGLNGLINYLFEHVKIKGTIFNDEKFNESLHKRNNFIIIDSVVEDYLNKECQYIESIKENNVKKKKENYEDSDIKEEKKEEESAIKKIWSPEGLFKISEIVFILVLIYISFAYFNKDPFTIAKMSFFNQKVRQTFDERMLCNEMFLRMTAPSQMNYWLSECYIHT